MPGRLIVARTFDRAFRFHLPDEATLRAFAIYEATPEAPPPAAVVDIRVVALGGEWYDFAPPFDGQPGTAAQQAERARRALGEAMADEAGADPLLHAALIRAAGRRLILVTPDHATRHRLALAALDAGLDVETATTVLLRNGAALAWPSRLRVLPEWTRGRPTLERRVLSSPLAAEWDGLVVHAVAPGSPDAPWRLTAGSADICVFPEAEAGALAHARPIGPEQAFGRLVDAATFAGPRGTALPALHALSRAAPAWGLRFGDPGRALWHLQRIAATSDDNL